MRAAASNALSVVIVDDEPLARSWLRGELSTDPEISIVGVCADGASALEMLDRVRPAVLFIDADLPELDGLSVLESIPAPERPYAIVTSASAQHAVRAFEVGAQDYLLKPIAPERLHESVERMKRRSAGGGAANLRAVILGALSEFRSKRNRSRWLLVKQTTSHLLLDTRRIDWIEASHNKVLLHCGELCFPHRESLGSVEQWLEPGMFLRVNRSSIVSIPAISSVEQGPGGTPVVRLRTGARLILSESSRRTLRSFRGSMPVPSREAVPTGAPSQPAGPPSGEFRLS